MSMRTSASCGQAFWHAGPVSWPAQKSHFVAFTIGSCVASSTKNAPAGSRISTIRIASYGQLLAHVAQPMHVRSLIRTVPVSASRPIAPVGQPIMHTGSTQCMQALATIRWSCFGPWRMNRGLLSCVAAQARTQSSHRVQRSRLISIVCVPLRKR